jgi:hypothetical protein
MTYSPASRVTMVINLSLIDVGTPEDLEVNG